MDPPSTFSLRFRLDGATVCGRWMSRGAGPEWSPGDGLWLDRLPLQVTRVERVEVVAVEMRQGWVGRAVPTGISVAVPAPTEADGGKKTFSRTVALPGGGGNCVRVEFRCSTKTPWRLASLYAKLDLESVPRGAAPLVDAYTEMRAKQLVLAERDPGARELQRQRQRAADAAEDVQRDLEEALRRAEALRLELAQTRQDQERLEREAAAFEAQAPRLAKEVADAEDAMRGMFMTHSAPPV